MRFALPLILLGASGLAQAQAMKPGLWEHSVSYTSHSGQMEQAMKQMQQQMASMPPDQRKMMEQMLAQQGMSLGPKGTTLKICVSKEDAEQFTPPPAETGCKQEVTQRSTSRIRVKFACNGPPPTQGEGEMNFDGPGTYSGRMTVNTQIDGKPEQMTMQQSGKWLSADCGNLKPVGKR